MPAGGTACSTVSEIHGCPENLYRTKLLQRSQDGALVIVASGFDANVDRVEAPRSRRTTARSTRRTRTTTVGWGGEFGGSAAATHTRTPVWSPWSDYAAISPGADHAVPLVTPPRGSRVGSRRIRRTRVTVPTHYACIPPGGASSTGCSSRAGAPGCASAPCASPSTTGALPRVDRRAPFRVVYRLPFAAGTRHVARARVSYRGGHASVGRMIVMCP